MRKWLEVCSRLGWHQRETVSAASQWTFFQWWGFLVLPLHWRKPLRSLFPPPGIDQSPKSSKWHRKANLQKRERGREKRSRRRKRIKIARVGRPRHRSSSMSGIFWYLSLDEGSGWKADSNPVREAWQERGSSGEIKRWREIWWSGKGVLWG